MNKRNNNRDFAAGASASLNRTITAIMKFLKDDRNRPPKKLRDFLNRKIADSNERWFRKGFNRGHRESYDRFDKSGKVPKVVRFQCTRELFTDKNRSLKLKSTIK